MVRVALAVMMRVAVVLRTGILVLVALSTGAGVPERVAVGVRALLGEPVSLLLGVPV